MASFLRTGEFRITGQIINLNGGFQYKPEIGRTDISKKIAVDNLSELIHGNATNHTRLPNVLQSGNTPAWESKAECPPRPLGHPSGLKRARHPRGMPELHVPRGQDLTAPLQVTPEAFQYPSRRRTQ